MVYIPWDIGHWVHVIRSQTLQFALLTIRTWKTLQLKKNILCPTDNPMQTKNLDYLRTNHLLLVKHKVSFVQCLCL